MTRAEHPLIGINGVLIDGADSYLKLSNRYADAVLKAGGIPVALPPVGGPSDVARLLDNLDGLVLGGGDDFDMERLGRGATHASADPTPGVKQDFDFELARQALERRIPVLGICYGMQVLGLLGGATLLQHLPEDRPGCREHSGNALHGVRLTAKSKLARVMDVEEVVAVSRHHQALSEVAAPWEVAARDEEGLIEAIEHATHPYAVGVQWHPELSDEGSAHDRLFRGLVGAAGMAAASRLARPAAPVA